MKVNISSIKIKPRLIGAFLLVAILAGVVGLIGVINIRKINTADTYLYLNITKPMSTLLDITQGISSGACQLP